MRPAGRLPRASRRRAGRRRLTETLSLLSVLLVAGCGTRTVSAEKVTPASATPAAVSTPRPGRPTLSGRPSDWFTTRLTLPSGRTYLLHTTHTGSPKPRPLLVVLHEAGAHHGAEFTQRMTGLTGLADAAGFDVVYGDSLHQGGYWNAGPDYCCRNETAGVVDDSGEPATDDVGYLLDVVGAVEKRTKVDPARVYLFGQSNGGMLAWAAICAHPDVFRAAVSMAGTLAPSVNCSTSKVRVLHIYGTHDTSVPPLGGVGFDHVSYPPVAGEAKRVGAGSVVVLKPFDGGHEFPTSLVAYGVHWLGLG